jgi:hypothetical protein
MYYPFRLLLLLVSNIRSDIRITQQLQRFAVFRSLVQLGELQSDANGWSSATTGKTNFVLPRVSGSKVHAHAGS